MLQVGVAGVGHLGSHHARIYAAMEGVRLVAVHDLDAERARAVAARCGTEAAATLEDLVARADAVSVAVPTGRHRQVAVPCLEAGVAVLLEKPMAGRTEDAEAILAAAERGGAPLMIGHVERWNGAFRSARPYLGAVRFVEAHRLSSFPDRGLDVDVILDLMIHDLDLVLSLARAPLAEVQAVGVSVLTGTADIANARLGFEDGMVANLTASRVSREAVRKMRIFQDDAYVSCDFLQRQAEIYRRRPGVRPPDEVASGAGSTPGAGRGVPLQAWLRAIEHRRFGPVDEPEPLQAELTAFVEALASGDDPCPGGADGLEAVALAGRVKASMAATAARMGVEVAADGAVLPGAREP